MPDLVVYTDGGARGNPGPAAIGIVLCDGADRVVAEHGEAIGRGTNNEAEYRALIRGLELAATRTRGEVRCVTDSELVVRQMTGRYGTKEPRMEALAAEVRSRARAFAKVRYVHRPRLAGHLRRADELVNEALDAAGA